MDNVNHIANAIADAYLRIAKADYYMVGFIGSPSLEDLYEAKQILITISNAFGNRNEHAERALDTIEWDIKRKERQDGF